VTRNFVAPTCWEDCLHGWADFSTCPCRRLTCRDGCSLPLRGNLTAGIHRLQHLAYLYLDGNQLGGTLPEAWGEPHSFPTLLEL
jgi:hypothetical protein